MARFDPDSVRSRNSRSGSSGSCERHSIATKATISAADPASSAIVVLLPQVCSAA
jgi:hypothetical protein